MDNTYGIAFPPEYYWLKDKQIFGEKPFSQMEPWYMLQEAEYYWINEVWDSNERLLVFARHQGSDLLSCLRLNPAQGAFDGVYVVQGWTPNGFDIVDHYQSIWDWMKSIIDDIREWAEAAQNYTDA